MLHRNCKTDIKEFLHVIVAQLLAPDLKEKVKKCVNIMLRSPEKHFSQKLVRHSSLENLNQYTKIGVPFSTAVSAAWFKFPQTKEVQPLVHKKEKTFY